MLQIIGAFVSLFLILIILVRIPRDSVGLASFANQSNLLGSPRSAERFLNILTVTAIFFYLAIAFLLNLKNN